MDRSRGLHDPAHPKLSALNEKKNKTNQIITGKGTGTGTGTGPCRPCVRGRTACRCYREKRTEKRAAVSVSELARQHGLPDDDVCFHVISTAVSVLLLGK